jgi:hypothetical protein
MKESELVVADVEAGGSQPTQHAHLDPHEVACNNDIDNVADYDGCAGPTVVVDKKKNDKATANDEKDPLPNGAWGHNLMWRRRMMMTRRGTWWWLRWWMCSWWCCGGGH